MCEISTGNIIWICLNSLWSLFLIIFNNRHQKAIRKEEAWEKEKKEKEEFKRIKKLIPEVISVVKKGLKKNPLSGELCFNSDNSKTYNSITGDNAEPDYYKICMGEYSKSITKDLYDQRNKVRDFLINNKCGKIKKNTSNESIVLFPEFLDKIEKWG